MPVPFYPRSRSPSPPLSPPPLNLVGSPYWRAPLPPVSDVNFYYPSPSAPHYHPSPPLPPPTIHRVLRYSLTPIINFDLSRLPSSIITGHDHRPLPIVTLAEPATNPPLPSLTIVSQRIPWPITVSVRRGNRFVSVSDVLMTLHHTLSLPVHPSEYTPPSPFGGALFCTHAPYESDPRFPPSPGMYAQPSQRRIDFLRGRTRFMGLSAMGREPGTWVLNTF